MGERGERRRGRKEEEEEEEENNSEYIYIIQDRLSYAVITNDPKSQWFKTTKIYFLLMVHIHRGSAGGLCSTLSSVWDAGRWSLCHLEHHYGKEREGK